MKIMCPGCGANLIFIPNKQKCYCEYCGSFINIENLEKYNNELYKDVKQVKEDEYDQYSCVSCGAKLLVTDGSLLTDCIYCGSRQLTKTKSSFYHKPVEIVPFKKDENYFIYSCSQFLKKAKEDSSNNIKNINNSIIITRGVYIPVKKDWYNVETDLSLKIRCLDRKKVKNKYFCYEAVLTEEILALQDASVKVSDTILERIEDYDFSQIKEFNPVYLSGFVVENANESEEIVKMKAEDKCINKIERDIIELFNNEQKTIGEVYNRKGNINFESLNSANTLLPVWFARLGRNQKEFMENGQIEFIMNGQTGKLYCKAPFCDDNRKRYVEVDKVIKKKRLKNLFIELGIIFSIIIFMILGLMTCRCFEDLVLLLGGISLIIAIPKVIIVKTKRSRGFNYNRLAVPLKYNMACVSVINKKILKIGKVNFDKHNKTYIQIYRNKKPARRKYN